MTTPVDETRTATIKGRDVEVRQLTDLQLMFMAREGRRLLKAGPEGMGTDGLTSVARVLDVLESAVVKEEDKEYLLDLTIKGQLRLADMMGVLTVFTDEEQPKPKVRRGRPPTRKPV